MAFDNVEDVLNSRYEFLKDKVLCRMSDLGHVFYYRPYSDVWYSNVRNSYLLKIARRWVFLDEKFK